MEEEKSKTAFVEWAKSNIVPISNKEEEIKDYFQSIANQIGNAKVVALSEGCHNSGDMMQLHSQLIRYLIQHHGFNVVVTESGLPESRIIYDYIQGELAPENENDVHDIYKKGLNKMYGAWEEGRELIEWMRTYNKDIKEAKDKVQYYGADIGGFYNDWKTPLHSCVIEYLLNDVDVEYGEQLSRELYPFLECMKEDARIYYTDRMTPRQQAELSLVLDEAVEHFNAHEVEYITRSSKKEFEWARQSLISMQLAENYYRNYAHQRKAETSKFVGLNGREIAMHRNIQWVMQQQHDPNARIIWICHIVHTKTQTQYQDGLWGYFTPAGHMLKQTLGNDLYVIGLVYGGGKFWKNWQRPKERVVAPIPSPKQDGIEMCLNSISKETKSSCYFVPWKNAPHEAWMWLYNTHTIRENDYYITIRPVEWDGAVYIHEVHPATPIRTNNSS